ncbi:MAG: formylglycine-generating enzyme family protein [Chloroflexi bacterium AL-W]|nr:formylglycine-generating enzyme family protein [Chloroflexi bacterium AL-N1]NOK70268.1 formylglycine-generating enzyme family protein [Chloroflexi bacterium AL-N10]NOK77805.1 formylglycine-generating enzyme family protein [Chloroflexi bacterium AL-N5]NOK84814.1 formylglycine-generating enzyme family protein [Chloroflexi bacterium AL-W]NOK92421.1 formylglycine-generating enzyme family protein [Chloroflexi bacterium AL-N15]
MDNRLITTLLPAFVTVPAASFRMGTPESDLSGLAKAYGGTRESYREETPQHDVTLVSYAIATAPVSNALYAAFVSQTGTSAPMNWRGPQPSDSSHQHPVVDVSWEDAQAFCTWLRDRTGQVYRLPTEAEWEHAARGVDGCIFPWGNEWEPTLANTRDSGPGRTTTPETYPQGASPYGCLDMAGNVWEWTASLDALYPYDPHDGREDVTATGRRILRGGCYANPQGFARCACRFRLPPVTRNEFLGFRLAQSLST